MDLVFSVENQIETWYTFPIDFMIEYLTPDEQYALNLARLPDYLWGQQELPPLGIEIINCGNQTTKSKACGDEEGLLIDDWVYQLPPILENPAKEEHEKAISECIQDPDCAVEEEFDEYEVDDGKTYPLIQIECESLNNKIKFNE